MTIVEAVRGAIVRIGQTVERRLWEESDRRHRAAGLEVIRLSWWTRQYRLPKSRPTQSTLTGTDLAFHRAVSQLGVIYGPEPKP